MPGYSSLVTTVKEGFQGAVGATSANAALVAGLVVLVFVVIQLFVVQFLWNRVLTHVVPAVRPLKTLLETLGLLILVAMLLPGCV
jgi:hypothetical protein